MSVWCKLQTHSAVMSIHPSIRFLHSFTVSCQKVLERKCPHDALKVRNDAPTFKPSTSLCFGTQTSLLKYSGPFILWCYFIKKSSRSIGSV